MIDRSSATDRPSDLFLRPVNKTDSPGLIALIDGVYGEYGDRVCLDDADRDLIDAAAHYAALGGEFVVLIERAAGTHEERVVASHAVVPLPEQPGVCTFRRLYLSPPLRGTGWGETLMRWALNRAREMGFRRVEFWSDTRFARAHRFFARLGFRPDGRTRECHDSFVPYSEYFFSQDL